MADMDFVLCHMMRTLVISLGRYNFVLKDKVVYGCQSIFE